MFLEFLKDETGKPSASRLMAIFLTVVVAFNFTYLTFKTLQMHDIPFYLFALIASLYGLNVIKNRVSINVDYRKG